MVTLGGGEKTLTAKGTCKVKWQKEAASLEIEINDLPAAAQLGWPNQQYVLWAIDPEKRIVNLGLVPLQGQDGKWKTQVPLRIFGLLVTAEKDAKAEAPGTSVVLESLLPTNPTLVVPVRRVTVSLAASQG